MKDIITEIWATARHNKLRTALTGFSVAWGIFMIIFLLGAGNGLINAQLNQQTQFLVNSMQVGGWQTDHAYKGWDKGRRINMRSGDVELTKEEFSDHVDDVGSIVSQSSLFISYEKNYVSNSLTGVEPIYVTINKLKIRSGRFINPIDMKERRKVMVMAEDQVKVLSANPDALIGTHLRVGNMTYQLVGIYKSNPGEHNTDAFVPYATLRSIYEKGDSLDRFEFTFHGLTTQADNDQFEARYRHRLNDYHEIHPDDKTGIWFWNRYTNNIQMETGLGIMRTALWVVGIFTLLSGIVGVSNIMLITVKERTREFGIRKAIGAKPRNILSLIIVESIIITTFFGYVGMLFGIGANEVMNVIADNSVMDTGMGKVQMFLNPTVGLNVCIEATLVMIIAGTIAGLIPSVKASRIRPIEALRAE
jgi:putative ABC transport system permease protein